MFKPIRYVYSVYGEISQLVGHAAGPKFQTHTKAERDLGLDWTSRFAHEETGARVMTGPELLEQEWWMRSLSPHFQDS